MTIIDFEINLENYFGNVWRDETSPFVEGIKLLIKDIALKKGFLIDKIKFSSYDWYHSVAMDGRIGSKPNFTFTAFRKDHIGQTIRDFTDPFERLCRLGTENVGTRSIVDWILEHFVPLRLDGYYEIVFKK